jgi:solute carrier family 25 iron transporter 28/37
LSFVSSFFSNSFLCFSSFSFSTLAHAAYFSVFESMKIFLKADKKDEHQPFRAALCGATAAVSHDFFMNPFDVIKQRMQLGYYKNTFHCMKEIIRTEGIRALYLSFPTTLLTNIPYGCIVVATNESARKLFNPSGRPGNLSASLAAGCIAGGVAAAATTPLDVIKTRLQTVDLVPCMELTSSVAVSSSAASPAGQCQLQLEKKFPSPSPNIPGVNNNNNSLFAMNSSTMKYHTRSELFLNPVINQSNNSSSGRGCAGGGSSSSLVRVIRENFSSISVVARRILREEGWRGFYRGAAPRVVSQAPAVAISWTIYETAKGALQSQSRI